MVMTLYTIVPVLAVMGVSVYVLVLLIRALRKYLRTAPVRAEKAETAKTLGAVLKQHRTACKMTQEFVAESIGVSRQAVSKWEMGTSVPSPENRRALSEILGTGLQVERETAPPVPLRQWKRLTLAAGLLCLALLAALGWILYSAHQDGWPPPEDP